MEEQRPALRPPQFGLRELLLFMAVVALCLLAAKSFSPLVSAVTLLLAMAVFAHVAGNAIGTKLRQQGTQTSAASSRSHLPPEEHHFAPITRLSHRQPLGWLMRIFTASGVLLAGIGGGWFLAHQAGGRATVANVSLAVLSCGVLGGLIGFWLSSFLQISLQALWQAHQNSDPDPRRRQRN